MKEPNTLVQVSQTPTTNVQMFDHQTTAHLARVPTRTLLRYWRHGLIKPLNRGERYGIFFDEQAIYRIRKAESIRSSMKTNIASATTVLKLIEEVETLRTEIKFTRQF